MNEVICINKPLGLTSYDVIRKLKSKYPNEKIGHAGTLDPLATGVLICLVGKANKNQNEYMNVDKEYEFDVLFGFNTDTYDVLGLVLDQKEYSPEAVKMKLENMIHSLVGKQIQKVPLFSAVKIRGKPLYRWYLNNKINEITIPEREIEIKDIDIIETRITEKENLHKEIVDVINTVKTGFRQKEVLESWSKVFDNNATQEQFLIAKLKAVVSKGTYVREIANKLGNILQCNACTITIKRTRVGTCKIKDCLVNFNA